MGSLNSFPQARGSAWESTDRPGPDAPCLPVVLALVCGQPQPLPVFAQVVSWEHGPGSELSANLPQTQSFRMAGRHDHTSGF